MRCRVIGTYLDPGFAGSNTTILPATAHLAALVAAASDGYFGPFLQEYRLTDQIYAAQAIDGVVIDPAPKILPYSNPSPWEAMDPTTDDVAQELQRMVGRGDVYDPRKAAAGEIVLTMLVAKAETVSHHGWGGFHDWFQPDPSSQGFPFAFVLAGTSVADTLPVTTHEIIEALGRFVGYPFELCDGCQAHDGAMSVGGQPVAAYYMTGSRTCVLPGTGSWPSVAPPCNLPWPTPAPTIEAVLGDGLGGTVSNVAVAPVLPPEIWAAAAVGLPSFDSKPTVACLTVLRLRLADYSNDDDPSHVPRAEIDLTIDRITPPPATTLTAGDDTHVGVAARSAVPGASALVVADDGRLYAAPLDPWPGKATALEPISDPIFLPGSPIATTTDAVPAAFVVSLTGELLVTRWQSGGWEQPLPVTGGYVGMFSTGVGTHLAATMWPSQGVVLVAGVDAEGQIRCVTYVTSTGEAGFNLVSNDRYRPGAPTAIAMSATTEPMIVVLEPGDAPQGVLYRSVGTGYGEHWQTERIPKPVDGNFSPGGHLALAVDPNIEMLVAAADGSRAPLCTYRRPGDPEQGEWCVPARIPYINVATPSVALIAQLGQIQLVAVTIQRDLLTYGILTEFAWPPEVALDAGTAGRPV